MEYPSLDVIQVEPSEYPDILEPIQITMRGSKNLFDIYFRAVDIETSFGVVIQSNTDITYICTPAGREKYLSYPSLKRFLFHIIHKKSLAEPYMQWVDSMLFSSSGIKSFFKEDSGSDIDETESLETPMSMFELLKRRIINLEHALEIREKDMDIMQRDILLRDKEIEILRLKLANLPTNAEWV
jgi:hypothetical protein